MPPALDDVSFLSRGRRQCLHLGPQPGVRALAPDGQHPAGCQPPVRRPQRRAAVQGGVVGVDEEVGSVVDVQQDRVPRPGGLDPGLGSVSTARTSATQRRTRGSRAMRPSCGIAPSYAHSTSASSISTTSTDPTRPSSRPSTVKPSPRPPTSTLAPGQASAARACSDPVSALSMANAPFTMSSSTASSPVPRRRSTTSPRGPVCRAIVSGTSSTSRTYRDAMTASRVAPHAHDRHIAGDRPVASTAAAGLGVRGGGRGDRLGERPRGIRPGVGPGQAGRTGRPDPHPPLAAVTSTRRHSSTTARRTGTPTRSSGSGCGPSSPARRRCAVSANACWRCASVTRSSPGRGPRTRTCGQPSVTTRG